MHWFTRITTAILLTILSIILLISAGVAYLIVTPWGGKILVRYFKQEFASVGLMHIGQYDGSLQNGFVIRDIRIKGLAYFPDALVRIQEIHVHLPLWDLPHSNFGIFNARIFIPNSDPVVFTGEVTAGQINGNLYAGSVDIHSASRFWAGDDVDKNLQGYISNTDLIIQGPVSSPHISGHFLLDSIRYKYVYLTDGFSQVNLVLSSARDQPAKGQVKGELTVQSGLVTVRDTHLELTPSKFIFHGDFLNPIIDIHLGSKVEDMDIHLAIKGPVTNPQLTTTSDPPMAPQDALRVLFTHNALSASTTPFNGVNSSELAQNFLDYSLQGTNDNQNIGAKARLTDNLKLGVEMDQLPPQYPGETNTYYSRKINGEMDLNSYMSLNISQEFMSQDNYAYYHTSYQEDQPQDTQVYWQYKKRF